MILFEKLEDLILDLRRLSLDLGQYPTVNQIKEGKCWKLFQHHAKVVRAFGGRDVIRKFACAGIIRSVNVFRFFRNSLGRVKFDFSPRSQISVGKNGGRGAFLKTKN